MSAAPEPVSDQPRAPQAYPREPHWVVVSMHPVGDLEAPKENKRGWRYLFRHPSEALANAECERLAGIMPGTRFTVYASGISHKIDKPEAAEAPIEVAAPIAELLS